MVGDVYGRRKIREFRKIRYEERYRMVGKHELVDKEVQKMKGNMGEKR